MKWINQYKSNLRLIFLILLVIAISGPWFFDRIFVPSPYACSAPFIRLDDEFCGVPTSMATWLFPAIIGFPHSLTGLVTGALSFGNALRNLLFFLFLFLLLLPVFTTVILILRGDHRPWQILHKVGLGLAAVMVSWMAWSSYSRVGSVLWGLWLYISLTFIMWVLEVLPLRAPPPVEQSGY
jgi:hypothetical protein